MTLTIELSPEIEQQLQAAALRQGQDPASFARAAVEEKLRRVALPSPDNVAHPREEQALDQVLTGLTGTIRSNGGKGGSRLSEQTGANFAQDLAEKQRQGNL